jgi:uncharacterized membrane protein
MAANKNGMPMFLRAAAVTFALLLGCFIINATPAGAFETYKVVGVAAGDKLVVREEPQEGGEPAEGKEIAGIPADATGVLGTGRSKEVDKQRWSEVAVGGVSGWVNARFLAVVDAPPDLKEATFDCFGTEPFWGVTLGPKEGEFSDSESKTALTTEQVQPAMARLFPLLYRLKNAKGQSLRATVTHQTYCTDGMSDYDYAFEVLLSDDEAFHQGCCFIKR